MLGSNFIALVLGAYLVNAAPVPSRRAVTTGVTLVAADVAESQPRDNTATRAVTAATIKTSDGQCLFVDPTSGDFRENLIPIQTKACDGSAGQQWDVITAGAHNDQPGFANIVSTQTNGCLNFDPRRAAGNQVLLFSCGGRADGGGAVTNSQLFTFAANSTTGPTALVPQNGNNAVCLAPVNGLLDQSACSGAAAATGDQLFTIGASGTPAAGANNADVGATSASASASASSSASTSASVSASSSAAAASSTPSGNALVASPVASNNSTGAASSSAVASSSASATASSASSAAPAGVTTGVTLDQAAVAEAQPKDNTATRAFTAAAIKTSDGQCLFVDPTSGDFRENLTPVQTKACDGSAGQQWDVITAGAHNNQPGFANIVSTQTNACLNFDPRRAAGNQVLLFSCGGRADGGGSVTNSQLFTFSGNSTGAIPLLPQNGNSAVCLAPVNGLLDQTACSGAAAATGEQLFTIG